MSTIELGNIVFQNFINLDEADLIEILDWRNHPDINDKMVNSDVIPIESHLSFVSGLKSNTKATYWRVLRKDKPCGVINIHFFPGNHKYAEWGMYLAPKFLGTGIGLEIGYEALKYFFMTYKLEVMHAYVKETNHENLRLQAFYKFKAYKDRQDKEGMVHLELDKETFTNLPKDFKTFKKSIINERKNK